MTPLSFRTIVTHRSLLYNFSLSLQTAHISHWFTTIMKVTCRRVLATVATAGAGIVVFAANSDGCGQAIPFFESAWPHDGEIGVSPVKLIPENTTVIVFSKFPDSEQSLLQTAADTGSVRVCLAKRDEQADVLRSFANRVSGDTYLRYEGGYYGLWVRVEDMVVSSTADPP